MPHPVDVHVGKRVRQLRWLKGMTQQQLARQIGVKFQQVQKYEAGANRVSASRLWQLCEALQVPVSFFFEELAGEESRAAEAGFRESDHPYGRESLELMRAYCALDADLRRCVLDLVQAVSRQGPPPPASRPGDGAAAGSGRKSAGRPSRRPGKKASRR